MSPFDADEVKLKEAMQTVYQHMHRTQKASKETLLQALEVMKDHFESVGWVCYVP